RSQAGVVRVLFLETQSDRGQLGPGLGNAYARPETANRNQVPIAALLEIFTVQSQGGEDLGTLDLARRTEGGGQDADDGVRLSAERDAPAHERGVGAEPPPQAVAQNGHTLATGLVQLLREQMAERRHHAQAREETGGAAGPFDALRTARPGQGNVSGAQRRHRLAPPAPVS